MGGVQKQAFRTYWHFLSQLRNSGMKVSRILADSTLCSDVPLPILGRWGLYFTPKSVLPLLGPLDRLLTNSLFKYAGIEVFIEARKIGHHKI